MPDFLRMEVIRSRSAISAQTQQRERPSPGRAKGLRGRQRESEQGGSPPAPRRACVSARGFAQGPKRSPVTVFGTSVFEPGSIESHEVAESPGVGIPCMLHESCKAGRQNFRQPLFARVIDGAG